MNPCQCPFGVWDLRFEILALILAVGLLILLACGPQAPMLVTIVVDGGQRVVQTTGATVRDVLEENGVALGELDRVEPDLWVETAPDMTVTVIRVEEKSEAVREVLPVPPLPLITTISTTDGLPNSALAQFADGPGQIDHDRLNVFVNGGQNLAR